MGRSKKYLTEAERIEGYRRVRQKCLRDRARKGIIMVL